KFLLDEAGSRKREAEGIIEQAKDLGMDATEPENAWTSTNDLLEDTQILFESENYTGSIEKAKKTMDGYKSVINSAKEIVEKAFFSLIGKVKTELINIEKLTEERDVVEYIKDKISQSEIFQREKRIIVAYQTLLEVKQLLDQLGGKIFFMELTQNTVIIAILVVIVVTILMVVFYKQKMSKFVKTMRIEEHKKRLSSLFKRKVIRPGMPSRERPRIDKEKLKEIHRLLETGESLVDTDVEEAEKVYNGARKIYNSLSSEERKLVGEEGIRLMRLYNNIVKRLRGKKG
ncbi:MAG: hypothetical protein V3U72_02695, partial [Candidatus Aenigmarchaeota archaeon]